MTDLFSQTDKQPDDHRPVLVGMNNPLSSDPRYALAAFPQGVTGHRIYQMLHERTGCTRAAYMRAFDRRNALTARRWDVNEARRESGDLMSRLAGRRVCVLGRDTLNALYLRGTVRPLEWQEHDQGAQWCYMPHPSGLNLWYNDEVNKIAVGMRLEQLYEESIRG